METAVVLTLFAAMAGGAFAPIVQGSIDFIKERTERNKVVNKAKQEIILRSIEALRAKGAKYWTLDDCLESKILEAEIMGQFPQLSALYSTMYPTQVVRFLDVKQTALRRAITGGDFQTRDRDPDLSRLTKINVEAAEFQTAIHLEFLKL